MIFLPAKICGPAKPRLFFDGKILTFSFYKHNYTIIMSDDERDQGDEPQEEVEDKEDKDDDEGGKKKKDPKKKFEVKKWNAVALWAWGTN
jgi:hypothetical protein